MTYHKDALITRLTLNAGYTIPFPRHPKFLMTLTLALREHQRRGGTLEQVMAALTRQNNRTTEPTVRRLRDAQCPGDYEVGNIRGQMRYITDQSGALRLIRALENEWDALLREAAAPPARPRPESHRRRGGLAAGALRRQHLQDKVQRLVDVVDQVKALYAELEFASQAEALRALGFGVSSTQQNRLSNVLRSNEAGLIPAGRGDSLRFCVPEGALTDLLERLTKLRFVRQLSMLHLAQLRDAAAQAAEALELLALVGTRLQTEDPRTLLRALKLTADAEHERYLTQLRSAAPDLLILTGDPKKPVVVAAPPLFVSELLKAAQTYLDHLTHPTRRSA